MKLYFKTGACSLAPHVVLRELNLPFELVKVDTKAMKTSGGADYLAINPKGYVPLLELDDGTRISEVAAILQYLAELVPERGLVPPAGTLERVRVQEWLNYIATELHKGFSPLFSRTMNEEWKPFFREILATRLAWMDAQLGGRAYVVGDHFTIVDAYLFTVLRWSTFAGLDLTRWPALHAWVEKQRARPSIHDAMIAEGVKK